MKKSVTTIILASAATLLSTSCTSTYFYSTLETTSYNVEKVENGDFLYENDSLWIAHCFKGEDAPIQITIFNKMNIPLYVDWSKSALILGNVAHSYAGEQTQISSSSESTTYHNPYWGTSHTYTNTDASIQSPQYVNVIPPQTMITKNALRLSAQFDEIKKNEYSKGKLVDKDGMIANIGRITYNLDNSPLKFGSYISIYAKPDEIHSYTTNFYVTNLIKTKVSPKSLPADMAERGDTFYQHKRPNNTGWEILGATAIVAGAVAVEVMVHKDDNCYHCH